MGRGSPHDGRREGRATARDGPGRAGQRRGTGGTRRLRRALTETTGGRIPGVGAMLGWPEFDDALGHPCYLFVFTGRGPIIPLRAVSFWPCHVDVTAIHRP